jgi:hypothetical protein
MDQPVITSHDLSRMLDICGLEIQHFLLDALTWGSLHTVDAAMIE